MHRGRVRARIDRSRSDDIRKHTSDMSFHHHRGKRGRVICRRSQGIKRKRKSMKRVCMERFESSFLLNPKRASSQQATDSATIISRAGLPTTRFGTRSPSCSVQPCTAGSVSACTLPPPDLSAFQLSTAILRYHANGMCSFPIFGDCLPNLCWPKSMRQLSYQQFYAECRVLGIA